MGNAGAVVAESMVQRVWGRSRGLWIACKRNGEVKSSHMKASMAQHGPGVRWGGLGSPSALNPSQKMAALQATTAVTAMAAPRPAMAQRAGFKATPVSAIARPTFSRTLAQRSMKAGRVQSRVVVVQAASDKASVDGGWPAAAWALGSPHSPSSRQMCQIALQAGQRQQLAASGAAAASVCQATRLTLAAHANAMNAGGGHWPGCRLRLRQEHFHAPVSQPGSRRWMHSLALTTKLSPSVETFINLSSTCSVAGGCLYLRPADTWPPTPSFANPHPHPVLHPSLLVFRSVTGIFGGEPKPPAGGNPDSNTLSSEMTTVICLDDYHSLDRNGRKEAGVTALAPESQNFDLMYEQVRCTVLHYPSGCRG